MPEFNIDEFNKRVLGSIRQASTPAVTNTMPGQMPRFLAYLQSRSKRIRAGTPETPVTPHQEPQKVRPLFPFVGR